MNSREITSPGLRYECDSTDFRELLAPKANTGIAAMMTPQNLAVVTIEVSRCGNEDALNQLQSSAEKFGIDLHVARADEEYRHWRHKLGFRSQFISSFRRIMSTSCMLTLGMRSHQSSVRIVSKIQYTGRRSFDHWCGEGFISVPFADTWKERFPEQVGARNYINSGVFIGPRDQILNALEVIESVKDELEGIQFSARGSLSERLP